MFCDDVHACGCRQRSPRDISGVLHCLFVCLIFLGSLDILHRKTVFYDIEMVHFVY